MITRSAPRPSSCSPTESPTQRTPRSRSLAPRRHRLAQAGSHNSSSQVRPMGSPVPLRRIVWAAVPLVAPRVFVIFFIVPADRPGVLRPRANGSSGAARCRPQTTRCRCSRRACRDRFISHRTFVRDSPAGERHHQGSCAGHGERRLRRCADLAGDRVPDRDPVGVAAAHAAGPVRDGLRPDRRVGAPGLDRAAAVVRRRLQARPDAARRVLRHDQSVHAVRRPGGMGAPLVLPWITFARCMRLCTRG